ncbi:MAG: bifunctional 5,10-methylenetetrahydrofolate dehydrogenase/5,10-methenyltetrahydrofolate cyclohydrolase [bacterium]|nr:bifunctional 5,10-methylenetetrahydrofolate dehydrogenase/5,10-methenyltetrahydrofolate cyclohydrolase [bacterium]
MARGPVILDGTAAAERRLKRLARKAGRGVGPTLGIIVATGNPETYTYIEQKRKRAEAVGCRVVMDDLGPRATKRKLLEACARMNRSRGITGYIVQLPLPRGIDPIEIFAVVDPAKDADGLTPENLGRLYTGRPGILPATPKGILELLGDYRIDPKGMHVTVVGKGLLTGLPLATLLSHRGATVTSCDKLTKDLSAHTRTADLVVTAAGKPGLITARMIGKGAVVVDVGVTRLKTRLSGDVDFAGVSKKARAITPVPGGVGPMTVVSLLENVYALAETRIH